MKWGNQGPKNRSDFLTVRQPGDDRAELGTQTSRFCPEFIPLLFGRGVTMAPQQADRGHPAQPDRGMVLGPS